MKSKIAKLLVVFCLILPCVFGLVACGENDKQVQISYVLNGGTNDSENPTIIETAGETIIKPATKEGHTFVGWYTDESFTQVLDGNKLVVTKQDLKDEKSVTLYAKYSVNQYTITFVSNGGSDVDPIVQDYGTTVINPTDPTKEGCGFLGWYTDNETFLNEYEFTTMPAEDITLYAKFQVESYTMTFVCYNDNGGSTVSITQAYGTKIYKPTSVTVLGRRYGYRLVGWCTDDETFQNEYEIDIMPAEDIILYAKWEPTIFRMGEEVTTIDGLIEEAKNLTTITIPSDITGIELGAFGAYTTLESVIFAEGSQLTTIGDYAFRGCVALTSIEIPASVTTIGEDAFKDCAELERVTFAEGSELTTIGEGAFRDCTSLTSIEIPASVTTIGEYAFRGCTAITNISVAEGNEVYKVESSLLIETKTNTIIIAEKDLTEVIIPANVTTIGSYAFESRIELESIIFAEGSELTTIGEYAFRECTSLTSIEIPAGVKTIDSGAFDGCTSIESITFAEGSGLITIGTAAFSGCTSLTSVEIPAGVKTIDFGAFSCCTSLTSIEIPVNVKTIGYSAFSGCTSLTSIKIPAGVTTIDSFAFSGCTSLTSIEIPSSVTTIGAYIFANCTSLTSIEIPSSVTTIDFYTFTNCTSLTSIEIPASVTTIESCAFDGCTVLESITFAEGSELTTIGRYAFRNCTSLTSIEIPASVTAIDDDAFIVCTALKTVVINSENISNSVTSSGSNGSLISYADTVYIKTGLAVENSTYLLVNFTKQETSDKAGYDKYTRNVTE